MTATLQAPSARARNYRPDDTLAAVIRDLRAKERECWASKPPRMGAFAIALMLDGIASRLEDIQDRQEANP